MAKNKKEKKNESDKAPMDTPDLPVADLPHDIDTSESVVGGSDFLCRKVKEGVHSKRSKNLRKKKAIPKDEKSSEKVMKLETKRMSARDKGKQCQPPLTRNLKGQLDPRDAHNRGVTVSSRANRCTGKRLRMREFTELEDEAAPSPRESEDSWFEGLLGDGDGEGEADTDVDHDVGAEVEVLHGREPASSVRLARSRVEGTSRSRTTGDASRDWVVRGPMPGGPVDGSVIPSYGGHVARIVWEGVERKKMLVSHNRPSHVKELKEWRDRMPIDVSNLVDGTDDGVEYRGLSHLAIASFKDIDWPLIAAFVERWQPDTNTFHMPFGEMTITLHDVFYILRVPVNGRLVDGVPPMVDPDDSVITTVAGSVALLLGMSVEEVRDPRMGIYSGGGVLFKEIVRRCSMDTGVDPSVEASGFLAGLLGSTLFVDKSKTRVSASLIHIAHDLASIHSYAWGASALAYLYRQLGMASRQDASQIAGCLTLLQTWIYEYFPALRPPSGRRNVDPKAPTVVSWSCRYEPRAVERLVTYRNCIDHLNAEQVEWMPFGRDPITAVPRSFWVGMLRYVDVIEPYDPTRVLRQFGFVQTIPRDPWWPDKASRPASAYRYEVQFSARTCKFMWDNFARQRLSDYEIAVRPSCCVPTYNGWFDAFSHPIISLMDMSQRSFAKVTTPAWWLQKFVDHSMMLVRDDFSGDLSRYRDWLETHQQLLRHYLAWRGHLDVPLDPPPPAP